MVERNAQEETVPVVEHLHLRFREIAPVRQRILLLQTRFSQRFGSILACEEVVRTAFSIRLTFVCYVEDSA